MSDRIPLIAACNRLPEMVDLPPEEVRQRASYDQIYRASRRGQIQLERSPSGRLEVADLTALVRALGLPLRADA